MPSVRCSHCGTTYSFNATPGTGQKVHQFSAKAKPKETFMPVCPKCNKPNRVNVTQG